MYQDMYHKMFKDMSQIEEFSLRIHEILYDYEFLDVY